jgi:hypothetical protein
MPTKTHTPFSQSALCSSSTFHQLFNLYSIIKETGDNTSNAGQKEELVRQVLFFTKYFTLAVESFHTKWPQIIGQGASCFTNRPISVIFRAKYTQSALQITG